MTRTPRTIAGSPWWVWVLLALISLAAFTLRFWRLDSVPPGWRDDELINSLVISQKVLDGDLAVYYPDASGHEALYHALNAIMLGIFGPGVAGIRWLSAFLGTLSVPLTFLVGRRLYGEMVGLVAAAALSVSFWSLMYSRIGLRHILLPVLTLITFLFFLRAMGLGDRPGNDGRSGWPAFLLSGLFMGITFYTYFASRGLPLILLAFLAYALLFARTWLLRSWRGLLLMFVVAILLALPLVVTLGRQPESEARVAELAVPLVEARAANYTPLRQHLIVTLSMFHADGDDEWLYNIPHRPVFGPVGAGFFWAGVLLAVLYSIWPLARWLRSLAQTESPTPPLTWDQQSASLSSAFLLLWWLAGISPGFISVPAASLGHTILAQPAVYLLLALPFWWMVRVSPRGRTFIPALLALALLGSIAVRDLSDYFTIWPERGMTRFLYRADLHELAAYLNENPALQDFGVSSLLAGPWDKVALSVDLQQDAEDTPSPRWYNPQRAILLEPQLSFGGFPDVEAVYGGSRQRVPDVPSIGAYRLYQAETPTAVDSAPTCFVNGLCLTAATYDSQNGQLHLEWHVATLLDLPEVHLISNPPPPGVYAGPRLAVFAQLQDATGTFLVGDDGLWVDPQTLRPGDRFRQLHYLAAPPKGAAAVVFGLYDPMSGERILTNDGRDHLRLKMGE